MRVSDLCVQYYNLKQPMHPPIKDEQKKDFTDRLFVAECTLLKVVDFKLDLDSAAQQKDYLRRFTKVLYEPLLGA